MSLTAQQKHSIFSILLLDRIAEGRTPAEAFDDVFGPGTHRQLAGDVYDALRAARTHAK